MGNNLAENINCSFLDEIFSENEKMEKVVEFRTRETKTTGLTACVTQFNLKNGNLLLNDELSNRKIYNITLKLARALDENSSNDIKYLKNQYGSTKEFITAKEFLNRKCKQIWDTFEKDFDPDKVPYEAMKTLGISNKQPLEFYLDDFLKYFEKDGGTTTVDIINSLTQNKYSGYEFKDICNYLKTNRQKYKFNQKTISYLAEKLDYNQKELLKLGIEKSELKYFYKNLPILRKLQIFTKNLIKKCNMY